MPTNKRVTDLTDYKSVLPYASEMFGVYQPMIGWKSKRILQRMNKGITFDNINKFQGILGRYKGIVTPFLTAVLWVLEISSSELKILFF